jgi:DNA-binding transcriptional MerR regulator
VNYAEPDSPRPGIASRISIGQVARATGLTRRAIRYYEERGLVLALREEGGTRTFAAADVERLLQIVELRTIGLSIEDICRLTMDDAMPGGAGDNGRLSTLLNEHRARLSRCLSAIEVVARRAGIPVEVPANDTVVG